MSLIDKMIPVDRQYTHRDDSGYSFTIRTAFHADTGWYSGVEFNAHGMATEEAAINALLPAAKHFTRVAEEK